MTAAQLRTPGDRWRHYVNDRARNHHGTSWHDRLGLDAHKRNVDHRSLACFDSRRRDWPGARVAPRPWCAAPKARATPRPAPAGRGSGRPDPCRDGSACTSVVLVIDARVRITSPVRTVYERRHSSTCPERPAVRRLALGHLHPSDHLRCVRRSTSRSPPQLCLRPRTGRSTHALRSHPGWLTGRSRPSSRHVGAQDMSHRGRRLHPGRRRDVDWMKLLRPWTETAARGQDRPTVTRARISSRTGAPPARMPSSFTTAGRTGPCPPPPHTFPHLAPPGRSTSRHEM